MRFSQQLSLVVELLKYGVVVFAMSNMKRSKLKVD